MESTLAVTLTDMQLAVGDEAGFGPSSGWGTEETRRVGVCVKAAQRYVYETKEVIDQRGTVVVPAGYDWSFLKPRTELTLEDGATEITLPDDFNGFLGEAIPASSNSNSYFCVPVRGEQEVYRLESLSPSTTGRPAVACRATRKGTDANSSERSFLKVFPTADQDYTLQVWYSVHPRALTSDNPYPYGAQAHAETFLAACRAAYEAIYDGGGDGSRKREFEERLIASVGQDRRMKPETLGPMLDPSDDLLTGRVIAGNPVSYAGITPGVS